MPTSMFSLPQAERINSKKTVDQLFRGGGSKAMSAFPVRVVYMTVEGDGDIGEPSAQMMVSVPKRYFKRAVKRNRVKRQVREAYRMNKHILTDAIAEQNLKVKVKMCFIWNQDQLYATADVEAKVRNLLMRLAEKVGKE